MSEYFSFLQATRPKVGLVDRLNLSEIYPEDQDRALRNLLLPPESLDEIRGLADSGMGKEDIRLIADLNQRVIDSLALFEQTDEIVSFDVSQQIRSNTDIGENSKSSLLVPNFSDNIIMLHGGIAANSIEYKFKDKKGNLSTATVSTSRESLFNSERDSEGKYTSASYGGTLRVRRRGHYSDLKLAKNLFVPKTGITESPTNVVRVPVYMKTPNTPNPTLQVVDALASKNSPFRIPVRINNTGTFTIYTQGAEIPYYFGYELRRKSDNYKITGESFTRSAEPNISRASLTRTINTTGKTGNNSPAYLYIYCAPPLVEELKLEGLEIEEDDITPDLGLIGFDNLKVFSCKQNRLSTIPTWLKVNHFTLEELDLRNNSFWNQGIIEWFDWQDNPGLYYSYSSNDVPIQTGTQILSYSGFEAGGSGAKKSTYLGTLETATAGNKFLKDTRKDALSINDGNNNEFIGVNGLANGIRRFTALRILRLGRTFKVANPDFSVIFPNLEEVNIATEKTGVKNLYGNIPKLHNNGKEMTIVYPWQTNASGNMRDMGDNARWQSSQSDLVKKQFVGQFKVITWDVDHVAYNSKNFAGGICTDDSMIGDLNIDDGTGGRISGYQDSVTGYGNLYRYSHVAGSNAAIAWDKWLSTTKLIDVHQTDSAVNVAVLESLEWTNLETLRVSWTRPHGIAHKVRYNPTTTQNSTESDDFLKASKLRSISAFNAGWTGRVFSIRDCSSLEYMDIGHIDWRGYREGNISIPKGGTGANEPGKYILPTNFLNDEVENVVKTLKIDINRTKQMKFRREDFKELINMQNLRIEKGQWTGSFPRIPDTNDGALETLGVNINAEENRFHDMSALSVKNTKRLKTIRINASGSGVGGAIIPDMAPYPNSSGSNLLLKFISQGSLTSKYRSSWWQSSKANTPVFNALNSFDWDGKNSADEGYSGITQEQYSSTTWPSSTTFTSRAYKGSGADGIGNVLFKDVSSGVTNLQNYVRVGDLVIIGGKIKGRVGAIFNDTAADPRTNEQGEHIIVVGKDSTDTPISLNYPSASPTAVTFRRNAISAEGFFNDCPNVVSINMSDCSLGGKIPKFEGQMLGKLKNLFLGNNLLTSYQVGTLQNITGASNEAFTGKARTSKIVLENNPLSRLSIRRIIEDAYDVYETMGNNRLSKLTIKLKSTKPNISAGTYSNWQLEDIFDTFSGGAEDPLKTKLRELSSSKIDIDLFDVPIV